MANTRSEFANWSSQGEALPVSFSRDCQINTDSPPEFQLLQAAAGGHIQELQELLSLTTSTSIKEKSLDINVTTKLGQCGDSGRTAISLAAENGYDDTCSVLAEAGADVDIPDLTGHSPLFYAAMRGNVECVKVLIAANANLEQKPLNTHSTALWVAKDQSYKFQKQPKAKERFDSIARALEAAGAKPTSSGCSIL